MTSLQKRIRFENSFDKEIYFAIFFSAKTSSYEHSFDFEFIAAILNSKTPWSHHCSKRMFFLIILIIKKKSMKTPISL